MLKLKEIYKKVYRRNQFSFKIDDFSYSTQVINVTFKYSNKLFNCIHGNTYVRFGYDARDLEFQDNICILDDQLVGVIIHEKVEHPVPEELLGKCFRLEDGCYVTRSIPTLNTRFDLRQELYNNGFVCDGIHYIRFKRSSGSARVGKCLFINEDLYPLIHKWETWGLDIKNGDPLDLAAFESYISLTTSSIIDTLKIEPESILVINDYESTFEEDIIATDVKDSHLHTQQKHSSITNSIWDGQSLIDVSAMGKYDRYGMVLLRNGFFKSCCFNCNIQDWFYDHDITRIDQLNGFTLAKDITDIKLITTPNSIKYLKFGTLEEWLHKIDSTFGVVKHDKKTHYFEGKCVQTHYQLLSTLQLSQEETKQFLEPSLQFLDLLHSDPSVVRYQIKYPINFENEDTPIETKNEAIFRLMGMNDKFAQTKLYKEFVDELVKSQISNIKRGHVLVNGNYSTLLGNPIEMLQESIKQFSGDSVLGKGNIHSKRFSYDTDILGSRSPHVTMGNVLVAHNVGNELIDKYFNLTEEIVCINSIGETILHRLSGAD